MLRLTNVHFCYQQRAILCGIDLTIHQGEIVALIGCSGSGKTTLFRLITGLLTPTLGTIEISHAPPTYMQQEDLLLPWRTTLENLLLLQELGQKKPPLSLAAVSHMLTLVGLEGYDSYYPDQLSGGQRQRLSLARALLQNRSLLLLDEPFGSLDVAIREQLYRLLLKIRRELHKTIVLVTHDFRDALELADKIVLLKEGKIEAEFRISEWNSEQLTSQIRSLLQDTEPHKYRSPQYECHSTAAFCSQRRAL